MPVEPSSRVTEEELLPLELPPEELPLAVTASELYSAFSVAVPALPSALRPLLLWKALTAVSVAAPKEPSTLPER